MRLSYSGLVCLSSKEDIVSSNLISRSTVNAFTKSFLLQLILDTRIEYLGSFLSYLEIFAAHVYWILCVLCLPIWRRQRQRLRYRLFLRIHRSRIKPTILGESTLLATSMTVATSSAIPMENRRPWVVPTVRVMWGLLVTPVASVSAIPTGDYRRARRMQIMYVMCFLLVVLNIDIIFTWIIPAGAHHLAGLNISRCILRR